MSLLVGFDHLNLTVNNIDESVAWYGKFFGFKVVEKGHSDRPWAIIRKNDTMLCIYESPNRRPINEDVHAEDENLHRIFHFGLRINSRKEWEAKLKEFKPRLLFGGETSYPHSTSWYVKDPTGYTIEVALWDGDQVQFKK